MSAATPTIVWLFLPMVMLLVAAELHDLTMTLLPALGLAGRVTVKAEPDESHRTPSQFAAV